MFLLSFFMPDSGTETVDRRGGLIERGQWKLDCFQSKRFSARNRRILPANAALGR